MPDHRPSDVHVDSESFEQTTAGRPIAITELSVVTGIMGFILTLLLPAVKEARAVRGMPPLHPWLEIIDGWAWFPVAAIVSALVALAAMGVLAIVRRAAPPSLRSKLVWLPSKRSASSELPRSFAGGWTRFNWVFYGGLAVIVCIWFVYLAADELSFGNKLMKSHEMMQPLGGGFSNGRRWSKRHVAAWVHDASFGNEKLPQVVAILKDWESDERVTRLGLDLAGTAVTDDGLRELERLNRLDWLLTRGTKVTADGVERLRQKFPNADLRYDPSSDAK